LSEIEAIHPHIAVAERKQRISGGIHEAFKIGYFLVGTEIYRADYDTEAGIGGGGCNLFHHVRLAFVQKVPKEPYSRDNPDCKTLQDFP